MDIKKLASIVEETPLTDESKNRIYQLLTQADDPSVQQQILDIMNAEAEENRELAEEVNEMRLVMEMGDREIADIEERTNEKVLEQYEDLNDKLDGLRGSAEEKMEAPAEEPAVEEKPIEQSPLVEEQTQPSQTLAQQPVQTVPQWNQPVAAQPAPFPGSQNQY